jgi:hypothetical protein
MVRFLFELLTICYVIWQIGDRLTAADWPEPIAHELALMCCLVLGGILSIREIRARKNDSI